MIVAQQTITIRTPGRGLHEVTGAIGRWVGDQGVDKGLLTVFCQHTSASLTIQENADPDVRADLETFFSRLVREDHGLYRHTVEGPDDMPAHIRAALTAVSLAVPVAGGRLALGHQRARPVVERRGLAYERGLPEEIL